MKALWTITVILVVIAAIGASRGHKDRDRPKADWPEGVEQADYTKPSPAKPGSQWSLWTGKDQLDDSPAADLSVEGTAIPNAIGILKPTTLWISCRKNKTRVYFATDKFLDNEAVRVEYRIDDKQSIVQWWQISTDYTAAGKWSGAVSLVKSLLDAETFKIGFTPYGAKPEVIIFDVSNLRGRIGPVADACHWKP